MANDSSKQSPSQEAAKSVAKDVGKKVATEGLATAVDSVAPGLGTLAKPVIGKAVDQAADKMDEDKNDKKANLKTPGSSEEKKPEQGKSNDFQAVMNQMAEEGHKQGAQRWNKVTSKMLPGPDTKKPTEMSQGSTADLPAPDANSGTGDSQSLSTKDHDALGSFMTPKRP